jgi:hypothetical protein
LFRSKWIRNKAVVKAFFNFLKLALAFRVKVKGLIFLLFSILTKRLVSPIAL